MNILTPAQLTAYKRKGWKVFQPGFDISYKSHWNTPWFVIREFFQNALDEHDQAGVSTKPSLSMTAKGVVIEDSGRGMGAESLLLRETKGEGDLRGRFGEGLKFACITAVRLGYAPIIESSSVVIQAHASPVTMGRVEATLLTFLYKEQEHARTGTRVTIEGYGGELYRDRFTTFLGKPIFEVEETKGRFPRHHAIYTEPKGRLYAGDIYIRDIEKSDYSYNLWELNLNPDRISEVSALELQKSVAKLWASVDSKELATRILKTMTESDSFESRAGWDWFTLSPGLKRYWLAAWTEVFGSRAVLSTDETLSKLAEGYGYKAVGKRLGYKVGSFLRKIVPTDEAITLTRIKELMRPKILPDSSLSKDAQVNLRLVRFLSNACEKCLYEGKKPNILAASIAPDPRTGDKILGLCNAKGYIYLTAEILETEESALSTFYHEMGHWVGGTEAVDGSIAHTKAVQNVASAMSLVIQRQYGEIADILGLAPAGVVLVPRPVAPWTTQLRAIPYSKVVEYDGKYSLDQLRDMARQKGLSLSGDKKALAARIIATEVS